MVMVLVRRRYANSMCTPHSLCSQLDDCDDLDGSRNPESVWYTDSDPMGLAIVIRG